MLLDRLHGATVSKRPGGADMNAEMEALASELRAKGKKPYVIPGGGSNPVGALGYVNAAMELVAQANEMGLEDCPCRARHRQRRHPGGPGDGPGGDEFRHSRAGHRRARAQGEAGTVRFRSGLLAPRTIWARPASSSASMSWPIPTMSAPAMACPHRAWSKR